MRVSGDSVLPRNWNHLVLHRLIWFVKWKVTTWRSRKYIFINSCHNSDILINSFALSSTFFLCICVCASLFMSIFLYFCIIDFCNSMVSIYRCYSKRKLAWGCVCHRPISRCMMWECVLDQSDYSMWWTLIRRRICVWQWKNGNSITKIQINNVY